MIFSAMSKEWPQYEDELDIRNPLQDHSQTHLTGDSG